MEDNESSLGLSIKVDVESINTTSNEYLVNFDYLVKLMNEVVEPPFSLQPDIILII
jgi:hypothetical protein